MDEIPQRVREQLTRLLGRIDDVAVITKGLSRSSVLRIQSLQGTYAVKQYPNTDFALEKLCRIHHFQRSVVSGGFDKLPQLLDWPDGQSLLADQDSWWELCSWRPGEPTASLGEITTDQLCSAMKSIAQFHKVCKSIGPTQQPSPGLEFRLRSLAQPILNLEDRRLLEIRRDPQVAGLIEAIARHSQYRLRDLQYSVQRLAMKKWECHWILRDIWRAHVLFENEQVSGVIDLGASGVDTPMLDVTRLLGTLITPGDGRWSTMVQLYCNESQQDFDLDTIRVLDEASTFLSGRNWLMWLVAGDIQLKNAENGARERWAEIQRKLTDYQLQS